MNIFKKFALVAFVFGNVILSACAEAADYYTRNYYDTNYYDNGIVYTPSAVSPEPVPVPAPLPSLEERVVPIGNTFAVAGDNIFVIKEDAGLWRLSQKEEPVHILDNAVSIWEAGNGNAHVHRTDGSLGRLHWENSYPAFSLFLEDVAYFDGRFNVMKLDGSLWSRCLDNIPIHIMDDVVAFSTWIPGGHYHMAITCDNRLWGWDRNWAGVVGGDIDGYRPEPVLIMENIAAVSVARSHAAVICRDGYLWAWGCNWWWTDETGDGAYYTRFRFKQVMDNVVAISAETNSGANYIANTLAIHIDGSL